MELAAQEDMLSTCSDPCVFFPLAAFEGVGENSRLGFATRKTAPHQGSAWSNSARALGIDEALLGSRVGCRSSGNSSWWGTFAKSLFTTNPFPTALKSFGEGGCNQILAETFAEEYLPNSTWKQSRCSRCRYAASKFASQTAYAAALTHAASATNFLGGQGLLYPFKSSIFSGLMGASKVAEEAAIPATLVLATAHAVYSYRGCSFEGAMLLTFEMTVRNILRRVLLYLGMALSFLAVMALIIVVSVRTGFSIPVRWVGLAVFTGVIGWFIFHQYRTLAKEPWFWLTTISIMAVHVIGFVILLFYFPRWPLGWFLPTTLVEVALIVVIMEKVSDRAKRL